MIKLTLRQKRICELLPKCSLLADVGCDHGKIGLYSKTNGKAENVVFIDISRDSLKKAKKLCDSYNIDAEFLCQDGLGKVKADCAVIAGMGGLSIIQILKEAEALPYNLILQPMKNADRLREYVQNFYKLELDFLFYDVKYYNLMFLTRGKDNLTEDEIHFGRTNLQEFSKDFIKYLKNEWALCDEILAKSFNEETANRRKEITGVLKRSEL